MFLHLLTGVSLFSFSLAMVVTPSASTSDPTITPGPQIELLRKQNGDKYLGWVSYDGSWNVESCDAGYTYYQAGEHWACCTTTEAGCEIMAQQCISGSLIYSFPASTASGGSFVSARLRTYACTEVHSDLTDQSFSVCNTLFMYQNEQDNRPLTNVNCGVNPKNWSYYRKAPTPTTTRTSSSSIRTTISISTTSDTSPTGSSVILPDPEPKRKSKAWIAGAVVGPVVGLALIAFLAWFCLSKRKKNKTPSPTQQPLPTSGPDPNSLPTLSSPQPPQYYPPAMQQNPTQSVPGMVPFGTAKQDGWASSSHSAGQSPPQSPTQSPPQSPPQSPRQQWPQHGGSQMSGQAMYAPSPSTSPQPQHTDQGGVYKTPQAYMHEVGTFSNELDGNSVQRR